MRTNHMGTLTLLICMVIGTIIAGWVGLICGFLGGLIMAVIVEALT